MKNPIINHHFEFWQHLGEQGDFANATENYKYTYLDNFSWPSRVFDVRFDSTSLDVEMLSSKMQDGDLPNSLAIVENEPDEKLLLKHNFELQSSVKGMVLELSPNDKPKDDFPTIVRVDNDKKAIEFARIATNSFGYEVMHSTISSQVDSKKIKLFLGKRDSQFVSCGMIFLDENGDSGLHMIGTLSNHRGLGLGKIMTNKLLFEAHENLSKRVYLVASTSGERIYSKIGFVVQGRMKSYSTKI